ncbi:MAG: hypothetical protein H8E91_08180 [Planctomycetes bacterium]|nr:hypothetical protein [Planctomycetota bacterium]
MTKIVTIIIIVSTVWSVISGIIEKNKKGKLAKQRNVGVKTGQTQSQLPVQTPVEIFEARINALRQRPPAKPPAKVVVPPQVIVEKPSTPKRKRGPIEHIKPLHTKDCPLPTVKAKKRRLSRAGAVSSLLRTPQSVRTAVILSEVISKPVSQR